MDLSLGESEQLLSESVQSFVEKVATTEVLVGLQGSTAGWSSSWTPVMAAAGWLGAVVPTEHGGSGATCLQAALICENLGRGPVPGPYLVSSVVGALLLRGAEPSAERDDLLGALASGDAIVAPVISSHGAEWNALRGPGFPTGIVSAKAPFVAYASAATDLLVPLDAGEGGEFAEFAVVKRDEPGVATRRLPGFLAGHDEVTFTDLALEPTMRCSWAEVDSALSEAYALLASYAVGGCQVLLERSVDYSNTRRQFGIPVGRFQRVQDHIVELVNALDAARWSTYHAVSCVDSGRDARPSAHMAMAMASTGYITCADAAHKVHGGIGVDPQFGLTQYTQMARSLYSFFGNPLWHKRAMADALGWTSTP